MKKETFRQVVKAFSFWKIDRRKGNYTLPSGLRLSDYLEDLTSELLKNNRLAFRKNGDIGELVGKNEIFVPFAEDERTSEAEQQKAIKLFVYDLLN